MIFAAGRTRCPGCDRPLDSTEDFIPVEVERTLVAAEFPEPGFYHPACLERLPSKDRYLRHFAAASRSYLEEQRDMWNVLELGERFALAYVPLTDVVLVYFLTKGRTMPFSCQGPWAELCDFLVGGGMRKQAPGPPGETVFSANGRFSLTCVSKPPTSCLGIRDGVDKQVRFTPPDFERLKRQQPDCGTSGAAVDFSSLCLRAEVSPLLVDGFLENCKGLVAGTQERKGQVIVRFVAERWASIELTRAEELDFRRVLAKVA